MTQAPVVTNEVHPVRPPFIRTAITGVLMGLANLVPGVSGGTMVVVMGLYDDFVSAIANLTRLRMSRRNIVFLAILVITAALAIGLFAGILGSAVRDHRMAMFSLFIGMTLGGAPTLWRMIGRLTPPAVGGMVAGFAIMVLVALTKQADPIAPESATNGVQQVSNQYGLDVLAGVLGISAMVLPGVSGAYMLLIIGRYEAILTAISMAKSFVLSGGQDGSPGDFLGILVPVAIGAVLGLVVLSNFLKWLLHRYPAFTIGALLGVLLGSVVGIWPFHAESGVRDWAFGALLAAVGFLATMMLARIKA